MTQKQVQRFSSPYSLQRAPETRRLFFFIMWRLDPSNCLLSFGQLVGTLKIFQAFLHDT